MATVQCDKYHPCRPPFIWEHKKYWQSASGSQSALDSASQILTTLRDLPRDAASALPFSSVDVLAIQPTQSLDALAQKHIGELPPDTRKALGGLGILRGGGGTLASYLLFEPGFTQALMTMGENDAYAKKTELLAFFAQP